MREGKGCLLLILICVLHCTLSFCCCSCPTFAEVGGDEKQLDKLLPVLTSTPTNNLGYWILMQNLSRKVAV